jgi:hypothetical protein
MTATLLTHGFEHYVKDSLFLVLKHGQESDCNLTTVKSAMKLVKVMHRKVSREAKKQPQQHIFYEQCHKVLDSIMLDLKIAYRYYKRNSPHEAYQFVQWARIRAYDIRAKL